MKITSLMISICMILWVVILQAGIIFPINLKQKECQIELKMAKMGYPKNFASSVEMAAGRTKLSPEFIVALMQTESDFNPRAVSSKGYKGLLQIPHAVYEPDANILIGANIFKEKMRIANGDIVKAICLYKGYPNESQRGREKARAVLKLYEQLSKMEV